LRPMAAWIPDDPPPITATSTSTHLPECLVAAAETEERHEARTTAEVENFMAKE
jgi:hypothetical protein